jgi:hypothetical protein
MSKPQRRPLGANLKIGAELDAGAKVGLRPILPPTATSSPETASLAREPALAASPAIHQPSPQPTASSAGQAGAGEDNVRYVTNSINLPEQLWEDLRDVATARRRKLGGRTSVSAIIREVLEHHREEWTRVPDKKS